MQTHSTPGVYWQEVFPAPPRVFRTGVPAFLGFVAGRNGEVPTDAPEAFTGWPQFQARFGAWTRGPLGRLPVSYVPSAVRGFFENGGHLCYVHVLPLVDRAALDEALAKGLRALQALEDVDLVCAPDLVKSRGEGQAPEEDSGSPELLRRQAAVLKHCEDQGDRLAILDSPPGVGVDQVRGYPEKLRQAGGLSGANGALYYPWIRVLDGPAPSAEHSGGGLIPPCGHVAGVFARTDEQVGVHKAPANEVLEGVVDLEVNLTDAQQGELNPVGVNCLRAFPGRGIRVWGARTLSDASAWRYVNVRRLFLTAGRWIERNMADVAFETHNPSLWARIRRDLTTYCDGLFRQGALRGSSPEEAFYVKCDEEINPPAVRDLGQVVTEIGLAPALPNEFVVVRIIHGVSGVTITGPFRPEGISGSPEEYSGSPE